MFNRKGFTLVELMIVVAIIGILAAIAIPNFISMQYKAKRGEVPTNIKAIKTAEIQYESSQNTFVQCSAYPTGTAGKQTQQWTVASSGGFETINWAPDGDVRGVYSVSTSGGSGQNDFTITGISDVDGDGTQATYTATKSTNPTAPTTGSGVY